MEIETARVLQALQLERKGGRSTRCKEKEQDSSHTRLNFDPWPDAQAERQSHNMSSALADMWTPHQLCVWWGLIGSQHDGDDVGTALLEANWQRRRGCVGLSAMGRPARYAAVPTSLAATTGRTSVAARMAHQRGIEPVVIRSATRCRAMRCLYCPPFVAEVARGSNPSQPMAAQGSERGSFSASGSTSIRTV